jgi:hypothetical protein
MPYSIAELLAELQRVADELGHSPSLAEFREHGAIAVTTYYDRFESWNKAISAAGYEPNDSQTKIPDDDLHAELNRLAAELGEPPSATQMNDHGEYWASTYKNRFGSWNDALAAAGLDEESQGTDIPEAALLSEIERLADELGRPPTFAEMQSMGEYSPGTYHRRFGSWNAALEAAGYNPTSPGKAAGDDDLLAEIERLASELGSPPTVREMDDIGQYASATYQRRFESWSAAVDAALE